MTASPSDESSDRPSRYALRLWAALLVSLWIQAQGRAVVFACMQAASCARLGQHAHYWYALALAVGTAALAAVFIAGGVGLVREARWTWRILVIGAGLQILFTVATQVWEAALPPRLGFHILFEGPPGMMGAVMGILIWNVLPVGILLLALGVQRLGKRAGAV